MVGTHSRHACLTGAAGHAFAGLQARLQNARQLWAVKSAGDKESGISIHFVNEKYDEGEIILQKKCSISDEDTPESIQQKVQKLEHEYFVEAIETILK
ncbi:MAG: formyltransferase family protein [Chitinophagales bacterium]